MDRAVECWTEERHSQYLNWIEASFVCRMLGGGVRLDRRIPDSDTESTGDSNERSPTATDVVDSAIVGRKNCNGSRKRALPCHQAIEDQVVPSFESSEEGAGESLMTKKRRLAGL